MAGPSTSRITRAEAAAALLRLGPEEDDDYALLDNNADIENVNPNINTNADRNVGENGQPAKKWKPFSYSIDWNNVKLSIIQNLDKAEQEGIAAGTKDILDLKQWLQNDLFTTYETFKDSYYVKTKTPGKQFYEAVTYEVCERYPKAVRKDTGNQVNMKGHQEFLNSFTHGMEHKGRRGKAVVPVPNRAVRSKGQPGVLAGQHQPEVEDERQQEWFKGEMINMKRHKRPNELNPEDITKYMHYSYELQRKEICNAVTVLANTDSQEVDDPGSVIRDLKNSWPFLFELRWQSIHFLRLCGHTVDIPLEAYSQEQLRIVLQYLQNSATESGLKNIAQNWNWEDKGRNPKTRLILALVMIANYFSETTTNFLKCAERTTFENDIQTAVPDLTPSLTLVALDQNMYAAKKFYICLDREVLMTACSAEEALTSVIQLAFILDVHYPQELKFTFEFLERVVCKLGSDHTKEKVQCPAPPPL